MLKSATSRAPPRSYWPSVMASRRAVSQWACELCTFLNNADADTCGMCGSVNVGAEEEVAVGSSNPAAAAAAAAAAAGDGSRSTTGKGYRVTHTDLSPMAKRRNSAHRRGSLSSVSSSLLCPITREIFSDPVVTTADGHTYEREAIGQWVAAHEVDQHGGAASPGSRALINSPSTGEGLAHVELKPNIALTKVIDDMLRRRPEMRRHRFITRMAAAEKARRSVAHVKGRGRGLAAGDRVLAIYRSTSSPVKENPLAAVADGRTQWLEATVLSAKSKRLGVDVGTDSTEFQYDVRYEDGQLEYGVLRKCLQVLGPVRGPVRGAGATCVGVGTCMSPAARATNIDR